MNTSRTVTVIILLLLAGALVCPLAAAPLDLQQQFVFGFPIDGIRDVIPYVIPPEAHARLAVVHGSYLMGLQWSARHGAYEQAFFIQDSFNNAVVAADFDGDGIDDLVTMKYGYPQAITIAAFDARTGAPLKSLPTDATFATLSAQNLDGAPGDELIVATPAGITAYKAGAELWRSPGKNFNLIRAGANSASRVVYGSDETGAIVGLDARTGAEVRRLAGKCYGQAIGQLDADASLEIACSTGFPSSLNIVDVDTGAIQWSRVAFEGQSVALLDADGNGRQDVAIRVNGSFGGEVMVLHGVTGQPMTGTRKFERGGLIVATSIGCEPALIVTDGSGTTFPDNIYLLDPLTLASKSVFGLEDYGISAMAVADYDDDGNNELMVHHDANASTISFQPPYQGPAVQRGASCCSFAGMAAGQLDSDRSLEYVLADTQVYLGTLRAFDGLTNALMWTATTDDGEIPRSVEIADLDGDGKNDVVTAVVAVHSGAKGRFVYAFNGATGKPLWRSINIPGLLGLARVAITDGGAPEVLALSGSIGIVHLNGADGRTRAFDEFADGRNFAVVNADADPQPELLVATATRLFILDQGARIREKTIDSADVVQIRIADVDGDGTPEVVLARQGAGAFFEIRSLATLDLLWTSPSFPLLINFAQAEDIDVKDVDNDGSPEVVFLSSLTVRVFRVGPRLADVTPPRFGPAPSMSAAAGTRPNCCAVTVDLQWTAAQPDASSPLVYEIRRSAPGADETLIGTTTRTEFEDGSASGATHYRYSIRVVDQAGNRADGPSAEVATPETACRRRRPQ